MSAEREETEPRGPETHWGAASPQIRQAVSAGAREGEWARRGAQGHYQVVPPLALPL